MNLRKLVVLLFFVMTCLGGCSSSVESTIPDASVPAPTPGVVLRGLVQTGASGTELPFAGAEVSLFEAGAGGATLLGSTTTDNAGQFSLSGVPGETPGTFYATARLRPGVTLLSVAGPRMPETLTVNELTTVAGAYSMAQFFRDGSISGPPLSLRIAAGMNDNLVSPDGTPSQVLLTSPNADQTNALRSTRSLANLLASSLSSPAELLELTSSADTADGLANLARKPARNVSALFALSQQVQPFLPALVEEPDAWTLAVKVNDSGSLDFPFGGAGNTSFDAQGRAWICNNVVQGTTLSTPSVIVLEPNGKPASFSPLTTGGVLGTGFGVEVDPRGNVWFGNFGWGGVNPSPSGTGSVSLFAPDGTALSGPGGFQGGTNRVQGVASDALNNLWFASFENDSLVIFPNGDPARSVVFQEPARSRPFDVAIAPDQTAWVTNGGGLDGQFGSSLAHYAFNNGVIQLLFSTPIGNTLKGVAVDSLGNAWISSQGDSTVIAVGPNGTPLGAFSGGGVNGPWGICVDGDDNIWVGDFGELKPNLGDFTGRLSQLAGANPATRPAGVAIGAPLTPATGYTLPSAGEQVLLANGDPLYGPGQPPSFIPFMRCTGVQIDRAGNVWACNNWKPSLGVDATSNPGGDGIVIFIGLAKPPR